MQLEVPGYRDRVVHIYVNKDEGGLNLDMPCAYITRLSLRGKYAGKRLAERFADPASSHPLSWVNHRWVRYRTTMGVLEAMLKKLRESYTYEQPDKVTYDTLINRAHDVSPDAYHWQTREQQKFAHKMTADLVRLIERWEGNESKFASGAPEPQPELRIRPQLSFTLCTSSSIHDHALWGGEWCPNLAI
jgi:hypothetical protein